jgi:hypothetical protein
MVAGLMASMMDRTRDMVRDMADKALRSTQNAQR